jgi:hypothetical protein
MNFSNRKKRGKKKFFYTYSDIGRILGVTDRTARNYACLGYYNPRKIDSVIEYAVISQRKFILKLLPGKYIK